MTSLDTAAEVGPLSDRPEVLEHVQRFIADAKDLVEDPTLYRGAHFDAGLAMVHQPLGRGGLGLPRSVQREVDALLAAAGLPTTAFSANPIGIGMGAPTLIANGSEEIIQKHLRRILTAEDVWCQLFSEPSHGSDVAGVATRAVRVEDGWVVNGQKVWTSFAHVARYGMLLARTNPDVPKHQGLSYLILDLEARGVEVRPLFMLTGDTQFNEVFLSDVFIPREAILGEEGGGWKVATSTLMNERLAFGGGGGNDIISPLLKALVERADRLPPDVRAVYRDKVAQLWTEAAAFRATMMRAASAETAGRPPGPEGSVAKLWGTELMQRITALEYEITGSIELPEGYPMSLSHDAEGSAGSVVNRYLRTRGFTIEGGTSEVQRNILGERVLGLPPDMRVDKDVPWNQIPR